MRAQLAKRLYQRLRVRGTFARYGMKTNYHGYEEKTVLILDVRNVWGDLLTQHLWLNDTKELQALGELKQGDVIEFNARVTSYRKGYGQKDEQTLDYRLSHPTRFKKAYG